MAEAWKQQEQRVAAVQKHTQSLRYMAEALQMGRETAHTVSMQSGTKKMCAGTRTECSSRALIARLLGIQSSWRARRRRLMTRSTQWICPSAFCGALLFACALRAPVRSSWHCLSRAFDRGMTWSGWIKNALTSAPQPDKDSQQNKSEEVGYTFYGGLHIH